LGRPAWAKQPLNPEPALHLNLASAAGIEAALGSSDARTRLIELCLRPKGGTPGQFADQVRSELTQWGDVAKRTNIRVDGPPPIASVVGQPQTAFRLAPL